MKVVCYQAGWRKGTEMSDMYEVGPLVEQLGCQQTALPVNCLACMVLLCLTLLVLQPEDFADLPEEHLSQDLHHHVRLGPMVRVHMSEVEMEQAMSNISPKACYHSAAASCSPSLEARPFAPSPSNEASSGAAENTPLIARA